ncbi:hypothetical protein OC842_006243 [Tilletia horrida]|uniref:PLD phosphodiesterase domain-containing protein n=1 Tax=Tilletia horrida TaxID=155126 RepID=A0AAN6G5V5_9BASI|nr:hypothetical protein OC842_006243 [Tilletia horrida]
MAPLPHAAQGRAISVDSDDDDGFEIVGGSSSQGISGRPSSQKRPQQQQQHQRGSSSSINKLPPPPSAKAEEMSSAETLRSLMPNRAELERERLERARRRQLEDGSAPPPRDLARQSEKKIMGDLGGRSSAFLLDGTNASQTIKADKEARGMIQDALRHAGLAPGVAAGIVGDAMRSQHSRIQAGTVGSSAQPVGAGAPTSQQAGGSTGLYWWDKAGGAGTGSGSSRNAAAVIGSSSRPAPAPSNSSRAASSTPQKGAQPGNPCPPSRKRAITPPADQPKPKRSKAPAASPPKKSSIKPPAPSTYDPYASVKASDRFWQGTIKHSFNRYALDNAQGIRLEALIQPRGKVSASHTPSGSSPSTADTRLEEIVASSYCQDLNWLSQVVIPTGPTWTLGGTCPEVTFFTYSSDPAQKGVLPKNRMLPNWTIIVPIHPNASTSSNASNGSNSGSQPRQWYGVMHCKFLILFYPDSHMRFILLSGNLVDYDWDRIENTAFIQDFPALPFADIADRQTRLSKSTSTPFGRELIRLFDALTMPPSHSARARLENYDLRGAIGSIVISAPQKQALTGWQQVDKWGIGRLGAVIRAPFQHDGGASHGTGVGLQPARGGVDFEAQCSSLGDLRARWLQQFHILASGVDPHVGRSPALPLPSAQAKATQKYTDVLYPAASAASAFSTGTGKHKFPAGLVPPPAVGSSASSKTGASHSKHAPPREVGRVVRGRPSDATWPPVRVCFPTKRWVVEEAVEGPGGAGTFFGKKDKFMEGSWKHLFYQPVSKRGNIMMHAKILLALQPGFELDDALTVPGWAPFGSSKGGQTLPNNGSGAKGRSASDSILVSDSDDDPTDPDSEEEDERTAAAAAAGIKRSTAAPSALGQKGKARLMEVDEETESERDQLVENDDDNGADERSEPETIGWVYTGSHNFTASAWGTLTDKKEVPSLSMSNWEVGIVLPLFDARDRPQPTSSGTTDVFDLHAHISTLARNVITYRRPLQQYGADDIVWDQHAPENQALIARG